LKLEHELGLIVLKSSKTARVFSPYFFLAAERRSVTFIVGKVPSVINKPQSALEPSEPRTKLGSSESSKHAQRAFQAIAAAYLSALRVMSLTDP
jgi:hypothetical protein